jgi:aldose 1-epimerase
MEKTTATAIRKKRFGKIGTRDIDLYTLTNETGMQVSITSYGAAVTSVMVPDALGKIDDVVLGYDDLESYLKNTYYLGSVVGRYCGRIAGGRFSIDGKEYRLPVNNGKNSLHGGIKGFDKQVWLCKEIQCNGSAGLELSYTSADGEEGYPGTLSATVTYQLTDNNELRIDYTAETDKATIVNLTNHTYFNLSGAGTGDILSHEVAIHAKRFLAQDTSQIPTGELRPVAQTPFDFTSGGAPLGKHIEANDEQISIGSGYDHTWLIDNIGNAPAHAATVFEPSTRRLLEVFTTEPGLHLYSGNYLEDTVRGKNGKPYLRRHGFCLETQHFPDSPNRPEFPSVVLRPGQTFKSTTVFKFSVR